LKTLLQIKIVSLFLQNMNMRAFLFLTFFLSFALASVGQENDFVASAYKNLKEKNYQAAIDNFSQALKQQPSDTAALIGIIRAYTVTENYKEAQQVIEDGIKLFPDIPDFFMRRGILNTIMGQQRRAISDFNKALELSSKQQSVNIYVNRGISYMRDEDFDRAIDDFNEALRINPRSSSALSYRGFLSYRLGRFAESIEDYNKALDLDPESAMNYYNRGMAHFRSGDKERACSDFHQSCSRGNMHACRMIMAECEGVKRE